MNKENQTQYNILTNAAKISDMVREYDRNEIRQLFRVIAFNLKESGHTFTAQSFLELTDNKSESNFTQRND